MNGKLSYEESLSYRDADHRTDWAPPALLLEVASGDDDLLREVVGDFERDTESRLEVTRRALAGGDTARLKAEAHAIKGSSRQVGAEAMGNTCQQIESSALQASPYELADRLTQLEAEFQEVCAAMKVYFNNQ